MKTRNILGVRKLISVNGYELPVGTIVIETGETYDNGYSLLDGTALPKYINFKDFNYFGLISIDFEIGDIVVVNSSRYNKIAGKIFDIKYKFENNIPKVYYEVEYLINGFKSTIFHCEASETYEYYYIDFSGNVVKTYVGIDEKCDKWLEFSGNHFDSEEEALTAKTKIINEYKKKKS